MKINAIIVLFRCNIGDSLTIKSLLKEIKKEKLQSTIKLSIFDNSPEYNDTNSEEIKGMLKSINYRYLPSNKNVGLATAYNTVLEMARKEKDKYLWLLDQDSQMTNEYLKEVSNFEKLVLVPQIISDSIYISPRLINKPFKVKKISAGDHLGVNAINSGTLLSLQALNEIQNFNAEFSLDFLDNWLFFELNLHKIVVTISNQYIQHHLSVLNTKEVSLGRYKTIIESEYKYYKQFDKKNLSRYKIHYFFRIFSQLLIKHDLKKFKYLLEFAKNKIGEK